MEKTVSNHGIGDSGNAKFIGLKSTSVVMKGTAQVSAVDAGSKRKQKQQQGLFKLPVQLASLIQGEENDLIEGGFIQHSGESASELLLGVEPGTVHQEESAGASASAAAAAKPGNDARASRSTPNQITAAAQNRCTRELSSYVRVVCMRLGFDQHQQ
jgi:hypothetical protein